MYAILLVLFIYLLNKDIQRGPEPLEEPEPVCALPDTFRTVFQSVSPLPGESHWNQCVKSR